MQSAGGVDLTRCRPVSWITCKSEATTSGRYRPRRRAPHDEGDEYAATQAAGLASTGHSGNRRSFPVSLQTHELDDRFSIGNRGPLKTSTLSEPYGSGVTKIVGADLLN